MEVNTGILKLIFCQHEETLLRLSKALQQKNTTHQVASLALSTLMQWIVFCSLWTTGYECST